MNRFRKVMGGGNMFFVVVGVAAFLLAPHVVLAQNPDGTPCTTSNGSGICRTTITGACQLVMADSNCQSGKCCITNPNPPAADGAPCASIRGTGECRSTYTTACQLWQADPTCESGSCCITTLYTGKADGQPCAVREGTGVCRTSFTTACQLFLGDPTCQSGNCCVTTVTQAPQVLNAVTCNADGIPSDAPPWTLVRCGFDCNNDGVIKDYDTNNNGKIDPFENIEECSFGKVVSATQSIINFLIYFLAAPIAALMFLYAGFLLLTNRGNESQVTKAKSIFASVFIGLVVALAAWLIVTFILNFFVGGTLESEFRSLI